ncbi:cellular communication network factor 1, like 2 [Engraulis encrasicolus]|uniref:cellular communication network factor 1, like 2 n=1 Tax=Engraulis encrasicolus TaxID=184585 RepID=UPI002FD79F50
MFAFGNSVWAAPIISLLLLYASAVVVEGSCPAQCSCPPVPPSCPLGVSWVTDGCGCCRVCARQFNQDCGPELPCDHIKGLHCHLGVGGDPERGLCRAQAQGRPCEFAGRVYQHGEDFQPSCQHQCSCMDGVVGCMPLCPHHVPLPDWRCQSPRLASLPGRCCQEWVCDDSNYISEEPRDDQLPQPHHQQQHQQQQQERAAGNTQESSFPTNHISTHLLPPTHHHQQQQQQQQQRYGSAGMSSFQEVLSLPVTRVIVPEMTSTCNPQSTGWSECSATCGFGVSSRITNENPECRLVKETRLCQIRECGVTAAIKKGKTCRRSSRPREAVNITVAGCTTSRQYRPRSCGSCSDGRCCWPSQTRTVSLRFHCPEGDTVSRDVMWIQRCRCGRSCPVYSSAEQQPSVSLHNDIHVFQGSPWMD